MLPKPDVFWIMTDWQPRGRWSSAVCSWVSPGGRGGDWG